MQLFQTQILRCHRKVLQKMASVSQDFLFLGQILSLCNQTWGRFHFYPAWRSSDGSEKRQTQLEPHAASAEKGKRVCALRAGLSCDAFVMCIDEEHVICTPVSATVSELYVLAKKQELIPMCWILSLEMGRSGLNDCSNGWAGEKEAGRCQMSGLDTHYLCFSPFKAGPFMLPQAAVPFSSSLPFGFGEFGISFTRSSWLLCMWPQ